MAFCGKCGSQVDDGNKFCPSCGAAMEEAKQPQQTPEQVQPTVPQPDVQQQAAAPQPAAPQPDVQQQAAAPQPAAPQPSQGNNFGAQISGLNNTQDTTKDYDARDISENKIMAVLAYLGLLWLVPFFAKKDSRFTQYHCKQGFTLLIIDIAYSIISIVLRALIKTPHYLYGIYIGSYTPGWLTAILSLISIPILVLAIIGIVNAASGKAKELPIIGKITILK